MVQCLKKIFLELSGRSGLDNLARQLNKGSLTILTYHTIKKQIDQNSPRSLAMQLADFRKQMLFVSKNFCPLPLEKGVQLLKNKALPANSIAITFDDGYADSYANTKEILEKYCIPATFFVSTNCIGKRKIMWNDLIEITLLNTHKQNAQFNLGGENVRFNLGTVTERKKSVIDLINLATRFDLKERKMLGKQLYRLCPTKTIKEKSSEYRLLGWKTLKEISSIPLFSVGAHGHNHLILSELTEKMAKLEISRPIKTIRKKLGECSIFSYPNGLQGDFNEFHKKILKQLGITCSVTSIRGKNNWTQDAFELRRIGTLSDNPKSFEARVSGTIA